MNKIKSNIISKISETHLLVLSAQFLFKAVEPASKFTEFRVRLLRPVGVAME